MLIPLVSPRLQEQRKEGEERKERDNQRRNLETMEAKATGVEEGEGASMRCEDSQEGELRKRARKGAGPVKEQITAQKEYERNEQVTSMETGILTSTEGRDIAPPPQ